MKYKAKWLCAILSLLMLLTAAPAMATSDSLPSAESQPHTEVVEETATPSAAEPTSVPDFTAEGQDAEILPELTADPSENEPAPTPETTSEAQATVRPLRVEFHIYCGENQANLFEYRAEGYPRVQENLLPGGSVVAPALPKTITVHGVEYARVQQSWVPGGEYTAADLANPQQNMRFSATYLELAGNTATYTVRHCWLGDPGTAICADGIGTAPVGRVFTYAVRDAVPGYVYARSENSSLTISADETQNLIVLYYSRLLTLTSLSAEKVYDGTPLARNEVRLTGKLAASDTLSVLLDGRITDVGAAPNSFREVSIRRDGQDITQSGYYAITTQEGTLTVLPASIEITAGSAYKRIDGAPLTCNQWALSSGTLAGGHSIASVRISGSQIELGVSKNFPSDALILDESGADVTYNYQITYCSGTLGVTERLPLLVIANSASKTYDGAPLADEGYSCHGLIEGDAIEANVHGSITGVGTAENTVEGVMITRNGREVTGEYEVATRSGSLTVRPAEIEITAESTTKDCDGAPLICNGWALTRGALAQGDAIQSVTVSGSQTEVGESENLPSGAVILDASGADVTGNYEITYVGGALRVTERAEHS